MGIGVPSSEGSVAPKSEAVGRTSGSHSEGTPNRRQSSASHEPESRSKSRVREALETSVAWRRPPDRFQRSHESIVPATCEGPNARFARIHASFVAEK